MSELALEKPEIFGGYLLLEALGRGAMGDVFVARPLDANRGLPSPIVVKRLHGNLVSNPRFVARFQHEAAIAVCIDHPHVATAYDVGAVGETLYIALEYVSGWPLSKLIAGIVKSGRHASVASVIDSIAGALEGLHALHTATDPNGRALDIVHRDLAPKNLMVDESGHMRLIDLGLGKSNAQDWRTQTGVVMGSVGYMAPEQALGQRADARADIYAMAVVTFEMLALRNYVPPGTVPEMVRACTRPLFEPPSKFRPDLPRGLDAVLQKALQLDPSHRYESAIAFLEALRSVVPKAQTDGGMSHLVRDIFGSGEARATHLAKLLATPTQDHFETQATRVFGVRDGVITTPQVRTTSVAEPAPAFRPTLSAPDSLANSGMYGVVPVRPGIGVGTLVAAVFGAALFGAVVAVVAVLYVFSNQEVEAPVTPLVVAPPPLPQAPGAVRLKVEPVRPAIAVSQRRATAAPKATKRRVVAAKHSAAVAPALAKVTPPVAKPPVAKPKPPLSAVDEELARLKKAARLAKDTAETASARTQATKILLDIARWQRSKDRARKRAALPELQRRLQAL